MYQNFVTLLKPLEGPMDCGDECTQSFLFAAYSFISLRPTDVYISLLTNETQYKIIAVNVPVNRIIS
jgi:hypothetical protein